MIIEVFELTSEEFHSAIGQYLVDEKGLECLEGTLSIESTKDGNYSITVFHASKQDVVN